MPIPKPHLATMDQQTWLNDLKRRVQHYGWRYDYKARGITQDLRIGAIPNWLAGLCERLNTEGIFSRAPDQVIINEYHPGQGISARKTDKWQGQTIPRASRISLTFRTVLALPQF